MRALGVSQWRFASWFAKAISWFDGKMLLYILTTAYIHMSSWNELFATAHRINCVMWVCAWVHAYVSTSRRPTVLSSQATSFVYFGFGNCENKQDTRHIYSKTTNILNELIPKLWKLQCIWKENIYSLIYDDRLKLFNCNVMFHNWLVKLTLCIAIETFLSCVNL